MTTSTADDDQPPYPDPVNFDLVRGRALAAAFRDAAGQLKSAWDTDKPLGDKALKHWQGPYGDHFRQAFGQLGTDEESLYKRLTAWASDLDAACDLAYRTQQSHDATNRLWEKNRQ